MVQGYFYYIFGFCFVVGALTVLITVEVAIVCTYVQLCAEDYLWWYSPPHMPLLFLRPTDFIVYICKDRFRWPCLCLLRIACL